MLSLTTQHQYAGVVELTKSGEDEIVVIFPDGEVETVSGLTGVQEYGRYFDTLGTLLGFACKDGGGSFIRIAPYVMLHNHGEYSLLDGMSKAPAIAARLTGNSGVYTPFFALTDHGAVSGLPSFDAEMLKSGACPILGIEVYAESLDGTEKNNHLILLVKDETGMKNLNHLFTDAQSNFYRNANVNLDMLRKYHEGLVCLTACIGGELPQYVLNGCWDKADEFIRTYRGVFGDDFYLEVQNHGLPKERQVLLWMRELSKRHGIKAVATTDSHYVDVEDDYAHEVLLAIGTGAKMSDEKRLSFSDGNGYHILSADEFYDRFAEFPELISNGFEVVRKCNFHFEKKKVEMPYFEIPDGYSEEAYFDSLVDQGYEQLFAGTPMYDSDEYRQRLEYEKSVIHTMHFEGYFLIVQDFINEARRRNIAIGPGRGSGAGSLVLYCLGVTRVDPIKHQLLFERFLNPQRISMPDIDTDISDEGRQQVIEYVTEKYGAEYVSRIVTFGTCAAKMACRDVARVLDVPLSEITPAVNAIPKTPHITLKQALDESVEFRTLYETNPKIRQVVEIARRIEGVARNVSQHACGVVIARNPIADSIPELLLTDKNGNPSYTAAYNMVEIEERGCIKFDFLGLSQISILKDACDEVGMDYNDVPLFDPEVYAYIGAGNVDGVFQIESPGMKDLTAKMFRDVKSKVKKLKTPEAKLQFGNELFERMVAAVALYRPGPMDYIPVYLQNMRNPSKIEYDSPMLEDILSSTYGVLIYQEQVQQICRKLAGYSYGRADLIRRAMGKKKKAVMDAEREVFLHGNKSAYDAGKDKEYVPGCIANGVPEEAALVIWEKMAKFAEYAFNRSHSAAYAYITVRTAYMKRYYPISYWAATLNSVINNAVKLQTYLYAAKKNGMEILPPSVNYSTRKISVENGKIRIGLMAVRNVGKMTQQILDERERGGLFTSLKDFATRCRVNKRMLMSLAYAGALDEFGYTRRAIVSQVQDVVNYVQYVNSFDSFADFDEMNDLFMSVVPFDLKSVNEFEKKVQLNYEKDFAGLYITEHPLDEYANELDHISRLVTIDTLLPNEVEDDGSEEESVDSDEPVADVSKNGMKVTIAGVLTDIERKITNSGKTMLFGKIQDKTGTMRFTVFQKQIENPNFDLSILEENNVALLDGVLKVDDFGTAVNVMVVGVPVADRPKIHPEVFETDTRRYKQLLDEAKQLADDDGEVVVELRIAFDRAHAATVVIDKTDGMMYHLRERVETDERNLRIGVSSVRILKELATNVK